MFFGQHHLTIEEKNRLTIPAQFRQPLSVGAFVTQGFDRNLLVLSQEAFQEVYQRVKRMNIADPLARLLLRMILGTAAPLELDASGRILLPDNLKAYANLERAVVLVGQGDYFEVWAVEHWSQQETQLQDAETNTQRFAALDLAPR